jgi:ABC-type transporter Mla subunit MlaD
MRDADTARAERDDWAGRCGESDAEADIAQRRADQAEDLLRVAHETSNRSEAERAAAVRNAEQADAVTAETKRLMERRTTTLRKRAERAEAQRDELTTLVRDIFASFTTARADGKTIGYQGPTLTPDQFEDWYNRAHDPASEQPAAEEQTLSDPPSTVTP